MPRKNKGPRLEQNERGTWEIRWTEDGRSKRVSTRAHALSQAQRVFAGFLNEMERMKSESPLLASEAFDLYDKTHIEPNVVQKDREREHLKAPRKFFGDMRVIDITQEHNVEFCNQRRSGKLSNRKKDGVSDGTIRRELGAMIAAFNHCAKKLKRLKLDDVPSLTLPPKPAPRDYWLTYAELDRLMQAAQHPNANRLSRGYRFIAIARYAAARKQAIEKLTWFQVDLDHRLIDFRTPGERRTNKRKVAVPICDELYEILKRAHAEKTSEYVLDHPGAIRKTFETAAAKAGLPDATPHVLRHSWATNKAREGYSMWEIAGVLGDSVETVTRNYLHHAPDHLRDVVQTPQFRALRADGAPIMANIDQHRHEARSE